MVEAPEDRRRVPLRRRAMLEVIEQGSASASRRAPLLMVHGAWHAAWCWNEHFVGFFADKGYHAVAVSLRGHGGSTTPKPLRACSLSDYVEDVRAVAAGLPRAPIVVGHSLGGLIVAKYLESHDAPAAVLMAPTFPLGYLGTGLRWLRRHPWHCAQIAVSGRSLAFVNTPELARQRFFSAHTPDALVRAYAARLQEESSRIGFDGVFSFPRPARVRTPILVLGAAEDGSVSHRAVRAVARTYHTTAEFFPGMGHDMMLETGWAGVAERIHTWIDAGGR